MKAKETFRCWAEIDHSALRGNLAQIRKQIPKETKVMGIIKANAYGHGVFSVAKTLRREGVEWFGVASVVEAIALRKQGIRNPILLLGVALKDEYEEIIRHGFEVTVSSLQEAQLLHGLARKLHQKAKIHFKIDTGMGRLGAWWEEAEEELEKIFQLSHLHVTGLCTHFSSADTDDSLTEEQIRRFMEYLPWFEGRLVHASNSAGFLGKYQMTLDCIRPGISLYGYPPFEKDQKFFKPVMTWKTRVAAIRSVSSGRTLSYGATYKVRRASRIGTLTVGYADGYPRLLSNQGEVLIHGKRAPIRGRVTMDQILVDVSRIPQVQEGDEVVLIGSSGDETILATDLAKQAVTISYEILCGISERVTRVHLHEKI